MTNDQQKARILRNLGVTGNVSDSQRHELQRQGVTFHAEIIAAARNLKEHREAPEMAAQEDE